tara:strand:- start:16 stop:234 length:219 start_codon:yes stop_codon:yes gene_type:complete
MARDYRREYDSYHGSAEQKKNRAGRNAARRKMGKRLMGNTDKDVHHKDGNPKNNSSSNLAIVSKKYNRSKKT